MNYYESMQDLIGNTPIVKLSHLGLSEKVNLFAKLELYNPAGSVKDRTGKYMIEDAERKGILKPGGTIIEGTAGNTGLGIAFAALNKGYQVIFVVPTKFSEEKQILMRALGAKTGCLGHPRKRNNYLKRFPDQLPCGSFTIRQIHWLIMKLPVRKSIVIWMAKSIILSQVPVVAELIPVSCAI